MSAQFPVLRNKTEFAERLNRTLIEMTRSMKQKFWAETLSTAAYLRNRSPTKAVKGMTPFEAFHGKKPNVKNLRAFGCVSFAHFAKNKRKKLDVVASVGWLWHRSESYLTLTEARYFTVEM